MKSQKYKRLYIIGNGFDLHHGLKSSYNDFRDYVREKDNELYTHIENYLIPDENWNSLESALANLDIDYIQEECEEFIIPYSADNWKDSMHHDYEFCVSEKVEVLSTKLLKVFTQWINTVSIPNIAFNKKTKHLTLKNSLFLNFNYTDVLTKVYQIKEKNIIFIHGTLKKPILGHAFNEEIDFHVDDRTDVREIQGHQVLNEYFTRTFKDSQSIINDNKEFFSNLKSIEEVYVLGHSIAQVDIAYFKELKKNVSSNVIWYVSSRSKEREKELTMSLTNIEISLGNINFIKLDE